MAKRFVSIWFRYLKTDWISRRQQVLKEQPVAVASPDHGRMIIVATNSAAEKQDIVPGMSVADARAIFPLLSVYNEKEGLEKKLLQSLAAYCIRFSPAVATDPYSGLIIDATGCAHLWGGEKKYLDNISKRLTALGFQSCVCIADTIGTAWAMARFAKDKYIVEPGQQIQALLHLPPESLRLDPEITDRLRKLGLRSISDFISMPRPALIRRFGRAILHRLDQALGHTEEFIQPVHPINILMEREVCPEPILTRKGIDIAMETLLEKLCLRLEREEKGIRTAVFSCFRIDGKTIEIEVGTNRPTHNQEHLIKLFENKIGDIAPGEGIEVFSIEATRTEIMTAGQEKIWNDKQQLNERRLFELLDRVENKFGRNKIHRYQPAEHYWPERSYSIADSLNSQAMTDWALPRPRPLLLLDSPAPISVTAPIPDYPPMLFRYRGKLHKVVKADGPERIEQEWWLTRGEHRDYYCVEDEEGHRFWVFRSGHYTGDKKDQWFLQGFFA